QRIDGALAAVVLEERAHLVGARTRVDAVYQDERTPPGGVVHVIAQAAHRRTDRAAPRLDRVGQRHVVINCKAAVGDPAACRRERREQQRPADERAGARTRVPSHVSPQFVSVQISFLPLLTITAVQMAIKREAGWADGGMEVAAVLSAKKPRINFAAFWQVA